MSDDKRERHNPTEINRLDVENYASIGMPHEHICALIGLKEVGTLKRHYSDELARGKAKGIHTLLDGGKKLAPKDIKATAYMLQVMAGEAFKLNSKEVKKIKQITVNISRKELPTKD